MAAVETKQAGNASIIYSPETNTEEGRNPTFGLQKLQDVIPDFQRQFRRTGDQRLQISHPEDFADTLPLTCCRSIIWKALLGVLPAQGDAASWISRITERREEYKRLFQQYKTDPNAMEDVDPLLNNPLSTEAESPWTKFYAEQELIETIHKDVNRLYPNGCESFFEKPEIFVMKFLGISEQLPDFVFDVQHAPKLSGSVLGLS